MHSMINIKLQKEIIDLLKANGGEMEIKEVCNLLGITELEIPWGYKVGWAKCLQIGGVFNLILQEYNDDEP